MLGSCHHGTKKCVLSLSRLTVVAPVAVVVSVAVVEYEVNYGVRFSNKLRTSLCGPHIKAFDKSYVKNQKYLE